MAPDGASDGVLRPELSDPAATWRVRSPKVPESQLRLHMFAVGLTESYAEGS